MFGHVDVEHAPPMVGKDDQDEQHAQVNGRNCQEIDRDQVPDMVGQERAPGLRRGCAPLRHQPGNGTLGHVDAELEELGMNTWRTPERIA
jgi:hypothetical protein